MFDQRPEMKDELLSLLQKIRVFGQALYGPILNPSFKYSYHKNQVQELNFP